MAPWNDFVKLVRMLKRQDYSQNEIVRTVMAKYPEICRNIDEAFRKIQEADRQRLDPNDW